MPTSRPIRPDRPAGDRCATRAERSRRTAELLERAAADPTRRTELLEEVVLVNRGVAESVAARYRGRGVPSEELVQVAYLGLVKAVRGFDGRRSEDLLTYAVPTIRGELQRWFRDQGWMVRPPRRLQELQMALNRALGELHAELGREPSPAEVQERMGVDAETYEEVQASFGCFAPTSLDRPLGEDGSATLSDMVADSSGTEAYERCDALVSLAPVVRRLPERDRRILYLRFVEERTQQDIGEDIGVTQMHVSRLLSSILERLREELTDE